MTTTPDYTTIYTTAEDGSAGLRCTAHPDWWADADGTNLPDVIRAAQWHTDADHQAPEGQPS